MKSNLNEITRVQIPALVHLTRLGYKYFGKIDINSADKVYDPDTNILLDIFKSQFKKLNPSYDGDISQIIGKIRQELDYDDLGKTFYDRLRNMSPKLIDFENPENNEFHFTAEFTCKRDEEEFRPDITLFVNGLPLVFIEVKRPYNKNGMIAESVRMNKKRFPNKKFRRFINITQLMIFSNNMEYDTDGGASLIQGAFYCTGAKDSALFNCFREENPSNLNVAPYIANYPYKSIDPNIEKQILRDYNCQVLYNAPEYKNNLNINTPTNRIITSMCSPERLLFILKYGIAYVKMDREVDGKIESIDQKHIMRYQQLFAMHAVSKKIQKGVRSGVIWHTQGSGKTALSYYLSFVLSDLLASLHKVAKFYFIVDRLDLLEQAKQEFEARGLSVQTANTRDELMEQFRSNQSQQGSSGKAEITVVNIQRFKEETQKVQIEPYATNIQRIFIIDEAHRGYNPKGSFLANLLEADKKSIKIALTGTPLLKAERESWKVFGDYLHTYYYDKSIQDGYTLKIIREEIETSYKEKLSTIYEDLNKLVEKKDIIRSQIIEHPSYVKGLLEYIISDIKRFRLIQNDNTLGGMIICETSDQARVLFSHFDEVQEKLNINASSSTHYKAGLILYNFDDKESRKQTIKDFKKNNTIDILIVFNMLLTGFDSPRLKRLYIARRLKDHNLLQAITRVNRPYKDNKYGYIIDIADIKKNFDETNAAYLRELNRFSDPNEIGEEHVNSYIESLLEDKDTMIAHMEDVKQTLFDYTTDNLEDFSDQIFNIDDKEKLLDIKKALSMAKAYCNIVRSFGNDELKKYFSTFDFIHISAMLSEVQNCINHINLKESINQDDPTKILISDIMQNISFEFTKISEEEMKIVSGKEQEIKDKKEKISTLSDRNIDKEDPEYISLQEAIRLLLKKSGFVISSVEDCEEYSRELDKAYKKLVEIQKNNDNLQKKYKDDVKFVRIHKRIKEENASRSTRNVNSILSSIDTEIYDALLSIKNNIDQKVYDKNDILKKDVYFERTVMKQIVDALSTLNMIAESDDRRFIQKCISRQYLDQYHNTYIA